MKNDYEIRIEVATRRLREHIAKAKNGYLPVNSDPQNWIDCTLAHKNSGYNDGYLQGLKTALDVLEGVFQVETDEAKTA